MFPVLHPLSVGFLVGGLLLGLLTGCGSEPAPDADAGDGPSFEERYRPQFHY